MTPNLRTGLFLLACLPAWSMAQTAMPNAAVPDKGIRDSGMVVKPPAVTTGEAVKTPPKNVDPGMVTSAPSLEQAAKEQESDGERTPSSGAGASGGKQKSGK